MSREEIRFETKLATDRGRKRTKIRISRTTTYLTPEDQGNLNDARFHLTSTRTTTWRRRSNVITGYKKERSDQPEENSEREVKSGRESWRVEEDKPAIPVGKTKNTKFAGKTAACV